mgnify:CR=1 FL=1
MVVVGKRELRKRVTEERQRKKPEKGYEMKKKSRTQKSCGGGDRKGKFCRASRELKGRERIEAVN